MGLGQFLLYAVPAVFLVVVVVVAVIFLAVVLPAARRRAAEDAARDPQEGAHGDSPDIPRRD